MRFLTAAALSLLLTQGAYGQVAAQQKEIEKEIAKLQALKVQVQNLIAQNRELLKKIEEERKKLQKEREALKKELEEAKAERYKKLALFFSKMDPEMAGQKLSALKDPKEAALILYNMKARVAGQVLNYIDPKMVNAIVNYLTHLKGSAYACKRLQESSQPPYRTPQE
jgi:flagellar motility protein MotE (MotC chaperone)